LGFLLPFVAAIKDRHNWVLEILKLGKAEDFVGIIIRVVVTAISTDVLFNFAFAFQLWHSLSFLMVFLFYENLFQDVLEQPQPLVGKLLKNR
jgi:hypothetical protein